MNHDDTDDVDSVEQDEHDDEHDDERDDGECGACHGSGGGDGYLRCPFCSGRGYVGRPRVRDYDDFDVCDRWEGYDDRNAEVNW